MEDSHRANVSESGDKRQVYGSASQGPAPVAGAMEVVVTGSAYSSDAQQLPFARPVIHRVPTDVQFTPEELEVEGEGIFCPMCSYNLSGVFSGRCPECGAFFNRTALFESQVSHKILLMPWDRPDDTPFFQRMRETLSVCLLKAKRFAFAFSVQPQRSNVRSFFACVLAACVLLALAFFGLVMWCAPPKTFGPGHLMSLGACVASFVLFLVLSLTFVPAVALWLTCPHFDGRRHLGPWLSICAYGSAHFLMLGACVPLTLLLLFDGLFRDGAFEILLVSLLFVVGVVVLWGCTMRAVIDHRRSKWHSSTFATAAVVMCALGCFGFSLFVALAVSEIVRWW